jgi:hypothetical protein
LPIQPERLTEDKDIWKIRLENEDIQKGIDYGIISRAWTYDRMGAQARGDLTKAIFRIAVGKSIQAAFERIIQQKYKLNFVRDTTDYKEEDYWDIRSVADKSFDLKSFHVFTDYEEVKRRKLTKSLILSSSTGKDWSTFFPMLIPRDQFDSEESKDYYVFAILQAPSSKIFPAYAANPGYLVAVPFSKDHDENLRYQIIHRRRFSDQRVREGRTFSLEIERVGQTELLPKSANVTIGYGDSQGKAIREDFTMQIGQRKSIIGLTAFHFLQIHESPNPKETTRLYDVRFRDVDEEGDVLWNVYANSFRDIWIHGHQTHFVGWIEREEFDRVRKTHKAFGPRKDYQGNTKHRDPSARGLMSRKSFCYFYPPAFGGGLQTPNYYCLPRDLNTMSSIVSTLR